MPWSELLLLSLANASIAFTVSETKLFAPLRAWLDSHSPFLGGMISCGYCLGHWTAAGLCLIYRVRLFHAWWPLDVLLSILVLAWLSGLQWIVMSWLVTKTGK